MQDLRVTLIQPFLVWEDVEENLKHFDELLSSIRVETDLIVLPEMFNTGFSMKVEKLAEPPDGKTTHWLKKKARQINAVVTGSVMTQENGSFYNRMIWMQPDGHYETYDKRHMFSMAGEEKYFSPGKKRLIVSCKGWNICPQVCYDLRFPVWNRNRNDYECIIFIANWPERRVFAWKNLLQARAIENQAYVIGVNRVGNDGNDIYHSGDSAAIDPLGEVIFTESDKEIVKTVTLSKERLAYVREKMPFLNDADDFEIKV